MNTGLYERMQDMPTAQLIERIADAAIIRMTREYVNYRREKMGENLKPPEDMEPAEFRKHAVSATEGQCVYMSAITGLFLEASFPERVEEMVLVQSHVVDTSTPQGKREARAWYFDTWLLIKGTDGQYYTLSPALHSQPPGKSLAKVWQSDTLEGAVENIKRERRLWEWPTADDLRFYPLDCSKDPEHFYQFDPNDAATPHSFSTVDVHKLGETSLINDSRFRFATLEPFE